MMINRSDWKTLKKDLKYKNSWINIYEDSVIKPGGNKGIYAYMDRKPGVFIIPYDGKSIYILKEYRYVLKEVIYNLPCGAVNLESSILENAKRELYEETGLKANKWEQLGSFYAVPGYETTIHHVFLATELDINTFGIHQNDDESIIETVKLQIQELKNSILSDKIKCAQSLAALNLFFLKYE